MDSNEGIYLMYAGRVGLPSRVWNTFMSAIGQALRQLLIRVMLRNKQDGIYLIGDDTFAQNGASIFPRLNHSDSAWNTEHSHFD